MAGLTAEAIVDAVLSHRSVVYAVNTLAPYADDLAIVGGAVRATISGVEGPLKDVDVMCSLDSLEQIRQSNIRGLGRNQYGNVRIINGGVKMDVFSPESFYRGFPDIEASLRYFDVDLNAFAVFVNTRSFMDPLGAITAFERKEMTLVEARWREVAADQDRAVLRARLLKLFLRYPDYVCTNPDLAAEDVETLFREFPNVVSHHVEMSPPVAARSLLLALSNGS